MNRKPSLAEQWFVEDALDAYDEMPSWKRDLVSLFDADPATAFSEIYKQSRAIRVKHGFAKRFDAAKKTTDWAALELMETIMAMTIMAQRTLEEQQPRLKAKEGPS